MTTDPFVYWDYCEKCLHYVQCGCACDHCGWFADRYVKPIKKKVFDAFLADLKRKEQLEGRRAKIK